MKKTLVVSLPPISLVSLHCCSFLIVVMSISMYVLTSISEPSFISVFVLREAASHLSVLPLISVFLLCIVSSSHAQWLSCLL